MTGFRKVENEHSTNGAREETSDQATRGGTMTSNICLGPHYLICPIFSLTLMGLIFVLGLLLPTLSLSLQ